ncbi:helix-turn-helix domain-containing protein [Actinokineospora enzanensis]|uniref:helix-turn-helix domain-containing protein n=1 Tax=Actinokineospora enzanensis TaxID=155975 RepID=UPI000377FA22|nr:helix-turn-helix transcriptional regulator [Actinokineospora enzanensis]
MAVGTTRGKRRLGRYVRQLMERAEQTPKEISARSRCAQQTVTRLLSGVSLPRIHLFMMILDVLGVSDAERERALELWEVADADMSAIEHATSLPDTYRRFRMDEREAVRERTLDTVIIPGLLQTPAYAAAKARAAHERISGWDAEAEAAERQDRQSALHRPDRPLELHSLIDESAMRRPVGGNIVFSEQLGHLLEMATLSHVTLQIIPFRCGTYGAMSGPLMLLSFPEDDEPDSAYVESLIGMHTVRNQAVPALSAVWDGAAKLALSPRETVRMIKRLRDEIDGHG